MKERNSEGKLIDEKIIWLIEYPENILPPLRSARRGGRQKIFSHLKLPHTQSVCVKHNFARCGSGNNVEVVYRR